MALEGAKRELDQKSQELRQVLEDKAEFKRQIDEFNQKFAELQLNQKASEEPVEQSFDKSELKRLHEQEAKRILSEMEPKPVDVPL